MNRKKKTTKTKSNNNNSILHKPIAFIYILAAKLLALRTQFLLCVVNLLLFFPLGNLGISSFFSFCYCLI